MAAYSAPTRFGSKPVAARTSVLQRLDARKDGGIGDVFRTLDDDVLRRRGAIERLEDEGDGHEIGIAHVPAEVMGAGSTDREQQVLHRDQVAHLLDGDRADRPADRHPACRSHDRRVGVQVLHEQCVLHLGGHLQQADGVIERRNRIRHRRQLREPGPGRGAAPLPRLAPRSARARRDDARFHLPPHEPRSFRHEPCLPFRRRTATHESASTERRHSRVRTRAPPATTATGCMYS